MSRPDLDGFSTIGCEQVSVPGNRNCPRKPPVVLWHPAEDVILDPICLALATEPQSTLVTLETLRLIRDELGVNTCCGASNIGFGLPHRAALSAAFLPMAVSCGLTSAITDVTNPLIQEALFATDLLLGHDEDAARWLANYRRGQRILGSRAAGEQEDVRLLLR